MLVGCTMVSCSVLACLQDMETFICRQTLTGHKDDVLSISGLLPPDPLFTIHAAAAEYAAANGHAAPALQSPDTEGQPLVRYHL